MFILGCPVSVKQLHHIFKDQVLRIFKLNRSKTKARIHFVYFSCARDINLLKLSLSSLKGIKSEAVARVLVIMDSKSPFTEDQQGELRKIFINLTFLQLGPIDWASLNTLKTEIEAFSLAATGAADSDFIAKTDSDILFFSKYKLDEICANNSDFIGDGHYSSYKYAQGGLYFIRASLAKKLSNAITTPDLQHAIKELGTPAEDRVISKLAKMYSEKTWLTRIMLFPDELRNANFSGRCLQREFAAIHFVKGKEKMEEYSIFLNQENHPPPSNNDTTS